MTLPFLLLCASQNSDEVARNQIADYLEHPQIWKPLISQLEKQGLSPLAYTYLQSLDQPLPKAFKRALAGLYSRHRYANQKRNEILAEVLETFAEKDISCFVLKGAGLACLAYDEPALRPMRDLDLLVKPEKLCQALQTLQSLDFNISAPTEADLVDKHLPPAKRYIHGLTVTIELHQNLFDSFHPASITIADLYAPPIQFKVEHVTAQTLGGEDMLFHLCQHIAYHASIWEPIRLIWVVDVVKFSETYKHQIDWDWISDHRPIILNMLSLFHFVLPLSDTLIAQAKLKIGDSPRGVGLEFEGWPRHRFKNQDRHSRRKLLASTFFPSEWWLRLHYRLNSTQSLFWYRWFLHPFYVLGPFYIWEKLKLLWYLRLKWRFEKFLFRRS